MRRPGSARAGVGVVVGAQALLLLVLAPRYGPHRDELYFAAAGRHLAWGYPDQPALVGLLARLSELVAPGSLVALRLWSILAVTATVVMSAALARLLGGDRRAQVLSAVVVATGAVTMFLGHRLTTQTLSLVAWTAVLLIAAYALTGDRPRLWVPAGLVAGLGLNAKHDVAVCLLGLLVGVLLSPAARHHLRSPWWWGGGLVALLAWSPNLVWQAQHGWPVFALSAEISSEYGGLGGALAYLAQTLLIFSPVMSVVWILGLVTWLRRPSWSPTRPLAWVFVVTFVFFLVTGGKAYYLVGAVVPLLVAGCVVLAERLTHGLPRARRGLVPLGAALVVSAAVAWPAGLPLLPAATYAASFYPAINGDQLETIGWPQLARAVRDVVGRLPGGAVVFTGNYGEAGALEWYGAGAPVYSGHNGYAEWGPPPDGAGPVVVLGYRDPAGDFTGCSRAGTVPAVDGADNEEGGGAIWVCEGPQKPWSAMWPKLVRLGA